MTPAELALFLETLLRNQVKLSTMIWGPPGIGKSSIVAQIAAAHGLGCVDLRLSQLAPTDLRGLPVAHEGRSHWYPPEFLPDHGSGILFLDEINMAPPAMQGMAQQLVLDRKVGSYSVPDGWFIWAAGNRQEDAAAVFEMPAPVANRFLHVEVAPDLPSFRSYALESGIHEQIIAFVTFRPALLHHFDFQQPAWPSPRSWAMASQLHQIGLDISAAVGAAAAQEFRAFIEIYEQLPDLAAILRGESQGIAFPAEPSIRYATVIGLTTRGEDAQSALNAFRWLAQVGGVEWLQLYLIDAFRVLSARGQRRELIALIRADEALRPWLEQLSLG